MRYHPRSKLVIVARTLPLPVVSIFADSSLVEFPDWDSFPELLEARQLLGANALSERAIEWYNLLDLTRHHGMHMFDG